MPEYHQIETYIDLKSDFSEVKLKCAEFFKSLGWLNSGVREWLNAFSWEISEDGFVYSTKSHPKIKHQQFDIQLMLLGWTPKVFPSLATNCVELEILFETEKIDDLSKTPQIRYTKQTSTKCRLEHYARSQQTFSGLWHIFYRRSTGYKFTGRNY